MIDEIEPFIDFTFSIGIHFNRFYPIKKSTKNQLIQKVKEICIPAISNLQDRQHIKIDHYYKIPKEIDRIYISRYDKMLRSINSKPEGGGVSDLTIEHIKPILLKKEQKIRSYDPCSCYWLIIREGNYYAGSFDQVKIETPLGSSFDKVFLIRTRTEELIELK